MAPVWKRGIGYTLSTFGGENERPHLHVKFTEDRQGYKFWIDDNPGWKEFPTNPKVRKAARLAETEILNNLSVYQNNYAINRASDPSKAPTERAPKGNSPTAIPSRSKKDSATKKRRR
jgi:hypothetical protein